MDTSFVERERKISEHVKEAYVAYAKALKTGLIERGNEKKVLMQLLVQHVGLEDMGWYNKIHEENPYLKEDDYKKRLKEMK